MRNYAAATYFPAHHCALKTGSYLPPTNGYAPVLHGNLYIETFFPNQILVSTKIA